MPSISFITEKTPGLIEAGDGSEPLESWVTRFDNRLRFVKGTLSDTPAGDEVQVGDKTEFSMKATPEQIMKIFYQVKDVKWTGGKLALTYTETEPDGEGGTSSQSHLTSLEVRTGGETPDTKRVNFYMDPVNFNGYGATFRGYTHAVWIDYGVTPVPSPPLSAETLALFDPPYNTAADIDGGYYQVYDIGDNEEALWLIDKNLETAYGGSVYGYFSTFVSDAKTYECAFNFSQENGLDTFYYDALAPFPNFNGIAVTTQTSTSEGDIGTLGVGFAYSTLHIAPLIAYVGADDPLDPDAELYIKLRFFADAGIIGSGFQFDFSTVIYDLPVVESAAKVVFDLGDNDDNPSAKIYVTDAVDLDGDGDIPDGSSVTVTAEEDFVMEITELWPYGATP